MAEGTDPIALHGPGIKNLPGVLRDALNPYAEPLWQVGIDALTDPMRRRKWETQKRLGAKVDDGIGHAAPLAVHFGFDETPLLWVGRYIRGGITRDKVAIQAARDLVARIHLRVFNMLPPYAGASDDDVAAAGAGTAPPQADDYPIPLEFRTKPLTTGDVCAVLSKYLGIVTRNKTDRVNRFINEKQAGSAEVIYFRMPMNRHAHHLFDYRIFPVAAQSEIRPTS